MAKDITSWVHEFCNNQAYVDSFDIISAKNAVATAFDCLGTACRELKALNVDVRLSARFVVNATHSLREFESEDVSCDHDSQPSLLIEKGLLKNEYSVAEQYRRACRVPYALPKGLIFHSYYSSMKRHLSFDSEFLNEIVIEWRPQATRLYSKQIRDEFREFFQED